jgi:hypothetical protein
MPAQIVGHKFAYKIKDHNGYEICICNQATSIYLKESENTINITFLDQNYYYMPIISKTHHIQAII